MSGTKNLEEVEHGSWRAPVLHAGICLALVAGTCMLYQGDLALGFLSLDDLDYVVRNPYIRDLGSENVGHVLTEVYFGNYSPLHLLSYSIDYAVGGLDARTFHLSSNLWAGACAAMLYLVGLSLLRNGWLAFAAALLFVLHPSHVEAVAWISSRKDLVACVFGLAAIGAWVHYREDVARRWAWYGASLVAFLFALAGKPSVVVVPGILFLYDVLVVKRRQPDVVIDKLPFAVMTMAFALRVFGAQPATGVEGGVVAMAQSFSKSLWLLTGFGEHVIFRASLDPDPGVAWSTLYVALSIATFAAPLLLHRRLGGLITVLALWVGLALVPPHALDLVHPVSDRYLFFPSAGLCLLIAAALRPLAAKRPAPGVWLAVGLVLVLSLAWGRSTLVYLAEWNDPRSVWYGAREKSGHPSVLQALGRHMIQQANRLDPQSGLSPMGEPELSRLLDVTWPDDPRADTVRAEQREAPRTGPATEAFQEELRDLAWESLERAHWERGNNVLPGIYYLRGKLLMERGKLREAVPEFDAAQQLATEAFYTGARQEVEVLCLYAKGMIAWRLRSYQAGLELIREAESAQQRYGGSWIPGLSAQRRELERTLPRARRR